MRTLRLCHRRPRCSSPRPGDRGWRLPTSVTTRGCGATPPSHAQRDTHRIPNPRPARDRQACASAPAAAIALRAGRDRARGLGVELIVTQAVCEVCAGSFRRRGAVAERLPTKPEVISLTRPRWRGAGDVPRLAQDGRRARAGERLSLRRRAPGGGRASSPGRAAAAWWGWIGWTRSTSRPLGAAHDRAGGGEDLLGLPARSRARRVG